MSTDPDPDDGPSEPPRKICPNCMTPNDEWAHLCRVCFTPLSAHSTMDPLLSITARTDTFAKASTAPRKPIVLLGMWLLFGPIAAICLVAILVMGGMFVEAPSPLGCMAFLPLGLFLFISAGLLYKTTVNYVRTPPGPGGFPVVEDREKEEAADGEGGDEPPAAAP